MTSIPNCLLYNENQQDYAWFNTVLCFKECIMPTNLKPTVISRQECLPAEPVLFDSDKDLLLLGRYC